MTKTNILVTLAFDDISTENIDTELQIQKDILKLLEKCKKEGNISHYVVADDEVISDKLKEQEPKTKLCENCISRQAVKGKLKALVNEMETIFADIREKNVDDSVCGLCEYDCDRGLDGFANECPGFERDDCFKLKDEYRKEWESINELPSVNPQGPKTGHCKWIKYDHRTICPKYHDIDSPYWRIPQNMEKVMKYCPYCGKEIEVEEKGSEDKE